MSYCHGLGGNQVFAYTKRQQVSSPLYVSFLTFCARWCLMTIAWMLLERRDLWSLWGAMVWGATRHGSTTRWTSKLICIKDERVFYKYPQNNPNSSQEHQACEHCKVFGNWTQSWGTKARALQVAARWSLHSLIISNGLNAILCQLAYSKVFSFQWRCKPAVADGGQVQMASVLVGWNSRSLLGGSKLEVSQ